MEDWNSQIGWTSYFNDAHRQFSKSFKTQFSCQLEIAFNKMTGIDNFAEKRGFQILVGMIDMKLTYNDGYGFGLLELITPHSQSIPQTFFWKTNNVNEAFKRDEFDNENIQLGFCSDFEKEYYLKFRKRNKVRVISGEKLQFEYIEEINLYPDLSISIEFSSIPKKDTLDKLKNEIQTYLEQSYNSDFSQNESTVIMMVDFQGTEFKTGKKQLRQLVRALNQRMNHSDIKRICVE